jgi:hypothetical protein
MDVMPKHAKLKWSALSLFLSGLQKKSLAGPSDCDHVKRSQTDFLFVKAARSSGGKEVQFQEPCIYFIGHKNELSNWRAWSTFYWSLA